MASTEKIREYELKQKAVQYYQENGVPKKMEEILNQMFFDNPDDVFGHLANYFESFAKRPTIAKISGREAVDSRGQPTIQTEVYCMLKNHQQLLGCSTLSSESILSESAKQEDKDAEDKERQASLLAALDYLSGPLSDNLRTVDPAEQEKVDSILQEFFEKLTKEEEERLEKEREEKGEEAKTPEPVQPTPSPKKGAKSPKGGKGKGSAVNIIPDEPPERLVPGSHAICAASSAVCHAAANASRLPLYKHLAQLRCSGEIPATYQMPLPLVTLLWCGRAGPGKLNCVKEFMVVPRPGMALSQSIKYISQMYQQMANSLCQKAGATKGGTPAIGRLVHDVGALVTTFDRPEQGLDMIQEAVTALDLPEAEGFDVVLDCAGPEMFDYDKGKYEVMGGQLKSGEDLVDFWAELLERYPCIIGLIDPMRKQEKVAWMRLCERISERCLVIGDAAYHRPGRLIHEELTEDFRTSGVVLRLHHVTTVSDLLLAGKKMEDADNQLVISSSAGETPDSFLADLAVAVGAKFIRTGAPCRGERTAKLNRLMQIESSLKEEGKLSCHGEHVFPHITLPPKPEDAEAEGRASADADKKSEKSEKKK